MKGKIIVLDGMDGTGKKTQSKLLFEKLKKTNDKVLLYSFPNYENDSSYFIKKYLKEGYCRDIDIPYLHDLFFSIDRCITFNQEIKCKYYEGYTIIFDRYTISNAIYRLHEILNDIEIKLSYLIKLHNLEHTELELPIPDLNIILYSDPKVNNKLIENRCNTENINRDLNETIDIQSKVFDNIQFINKYCSGCYYDIFGPIELIKIHDDETIFSKEKISDMINETIYRLHI